MEEILTFPKWKPNWITLNTIQDSLDAKKSFKAFRSASSGFISNKKVRYILLEKFNHKCAVCFDTKQLDIDHIKSVYNCFKSKEFEYCNSYENLQVLCHQCNLNKGYTNG